MVRRSGSASHDEAVVVARRKRLFEPDLREHALAGADSVALHEQHPAEDLARAVVYMHARPALERLLLAREVGEARVEAVGHGERAGFGHDVAARDLVLLEADDVERHPVAGHGLLDLLPVHLHRADATALA